MCECNDEQVESLDFVDPVFRCLPRPLRRLARNSSPATANSARLRVLAEGALRDFAPSEETECACAEKEGLEQERRPEAALRARMWFRVEPDQRRWDRWSVTVMCA